jgi:hypothetical protein
LVASTDALLRLELRSKVFHPQDEGGLARSIRISMSGSMRLFRSTDTRLHLSGLEAVVGAPLAGDLRTIWVDTGTVTL